MARCAAMSSPIKKKLVWKNNRVVAVDDSAYVLALKGTDLILVAVDMGTHDFIHPPTLGETHLPLFCNYNV